MKMLKVAMGGVLSVAVMGVVGCDLLLSGRQRETVYVDQGPRYVDQPVVMVDQPPQYVVVQQAPPPIRYEARPPAPSVDVVWIDGYWNWDNRSYVWESGHYMRPPQAGVVWMAPRYETVGGSVRYTSGGWSRGAGNGRGNGPGDGPGRGR